MGHTENYFEKKRKITLTELLFTILAPYVMGLANLPSNGKYCLTNNIIVDHIKWVLWYLWYMWYLWYLAFCEATTVDATYCDHIGVDHN